jgi:hypothetical protein
MSFLAMDGSWHLVSIYLNLYNFIFPFTRGDAYYANERLHL